MPPERRIEFRIGIHLGDVVEEADGDLMGSGVNIAARLESIARPGALGSSTRPLAVQTESLQRDQTVTSPPRARHPFMPPGKCLRSLRPAAWAWFNALRERPPA